MGVSFAARKHPVLTTLRDTKARVTLVGEVALSIPNGQPGHERGGNGLPKKPAPGRGQHRMKGTALMLCWQSQLLKLWAEKSGRWDSGRGDWFFTGDKLASSQAYPRPDRQLLGLPISPKFPPVFGPSCMRQKLVPRTVRRPSPTPAVMVRLRSTNTKKIQFTQRLTVGSELHMGKERCCLRGLDHLHGPTSHSICGNLMIYKPSLTNDRLMFELMNHFMPTSC
uniref:Uncharacterized protein n=1 Tax=Brassica oleracea var. oleracea TaxID=109376 RepID=A0A0D3D456_BRAOL